MEKDIYSRIGDFFSNQAVNQTTKENLRKVLSADQFAKQYPSVGRRFAGTLSSLFNKGKDFVGDIKFNPKFVKPVAKQGARFGGRKIPIIGGSIGTSLDIADGMDPTQAFARNIIGQTLGVGGGALGSVVGPAGSLGGYLAGDQLGRTATDRVFDVFSGEASAGDPITGGFLGGPLPTVNQPQAPSTEESLAKYGFNDDFELQPRDDGTFGVVRSDEGDYQDFLNRTRNSPAMQSGAFDPRDLFETYKSNQQFQADKKSGKLKKDRMAGEKVRITMPMDME